MKTCLLAVGLLLAATGTLRAASLEVIGVLEPPFPNDIAIDVTTTTRTLSVAAEYSGGLSFVDSTNPSAPFLLGSLAFPRSAVCAAIRGPIALGGDIDGLLHSIDISNPATPIRLDTFDVGGRIQDIEVAGDRAYLATLGSGIQVVDISNPSSLSRAGASGSGFYWHVVVSGTRAYASSESDGFQVQVLDISNPDFPAPIGRLLLPSNPHGLAVKGSLAYVTAQQAGLMIVDISNPAAPSLLGTYDTPGSAEDVAVDGSLAYVADYDSILVLDVSDPASPVLLASRIAPGSAQTIAFRDSVIHVGGVGVMGYRLMQFVADPPRLSNLSTRGFVGLPEDDRGMIGGLIVSGSAARRVLVSGIGPDLANFAVPGFLPNPTLTIFQGQSVMTSNDDWQSSPDAAVIGATGHAPNHPLESAVIVTLDPGEYTALLSGAGANEAERSGVGLVQAFDLGPVEGASGASRLSNLSTRLEVGSGDRVMIAGFIVEAGEGSPTQRVVIRSLGPTLAEPPFGVIGALSDPELAVFSGETRIAANDNWRESDEAAAIQTAGLAPPADAEPAILLDLAAGAYTAIVSGAGGGVALVEVYAID